MPKKARILSSRTAAAVGRFRWAKRDASTSRLLSTKVARIQRRSIALREILALATSVVGSREAAERWLSTRVPALDGARPKDLLRTEHGAARVREALHQIEHGIFA